jgi:transcriptional regulator with XRE-family HTH domain
MPTPTTAELIDQLFRTHRKPDGKEYSHVELSTALGGALASSHIGKLRAGTIRNPKRDTLLLLCRFFQVPPTYFFPELPPEPADPTTDVLARVLQQFTLPVQAKQALADFLRALMTRG